MYPYIVCFCGRPLGHLYNAFLAMCRDHARSSRANEPVGYILDQLNIMKLCCRTRMLTQTQFKDYYNIPNPPTLIPTEAMLGKKTSAMPSQATSKPEAAKEPATSKHVAAKEPSVPKAKPSRKGKEKAADD